MRRVVTACRRQIRRSGNGKPCVAWPLVCTGNGVSYIGRIGVRTCSPGGCGDWATGTVGTPR